MSLLKYVKYLRQSLTLSDVLWQRQENITALLDLLNAQDFFSRLYSLQLISAISTARPERTQECVYTAPLGVSRLVAILEDKREAVRSGMQERWLQINPGELTFGQKDCSC